MVDQMYELSLSSQSCNTDCKGKKEESIMIIMYYVHAIMKNLASGLSRIISTQLITVWSHQLYSCFPRLAVQIVSYLGHPQTVTYICKWELILIVVVASSITLSLCNGWSDESDDVHVK